MFPGKKASPSVPKAISDAIYKVRDEIPLHADCAPTSDSENSMPLFVFKFSTQLWRLYPKTGMKSNHLYLARIYIRYRATFFAGPII